MADGSSFQIVSKRISNYSTSTNVGVSKPIRDFFPIFIKFYERAIEINGK